MRLEEIKQRCVAIVSVGPLDKNEDGTWPVGFGFQVGQFYQCTIDPARFSPCGEFYRFGTFQGDELVGWQLVDAMRVVSVLADWDGDEPPTMHWATAKE